MCQPLSNAINNSLSKGTFPHDATIAMVSLLHKGTSNNRPVSILATFSKIYERVSKKLIDKAMDKYLSPFISAFRQNYKTQHVLIRLLEEWREGLDNNFDVGGVFMDLSKTFHCISHDLLIAKLKAYGFDDYLVHYLYSYLDNRKQFVRINNEKSSLQNIISGVPQGSIVGPTLFNLFFSDFLLFVLIASVHNFTDDNSLSNVAKTIDSLKQTLESELKVVNKSFHENKMIVNRDKFQVIVLDKRRSLNNEVKFITGSE